MKKIIASLALVLSMAATCGEPEKSPKKIETPKSVSGTSREEFVKEKTTALSDDGSTQYWLVIRKVRSEVEYVIQVPRSKFDACTEGQTWNKVLKSCE